MGGCRGGWRAGRRSLRRTRCSGASSGRGKAVVAVELEVDGVFEALLFGYVKRSHHWE